MAGMQQEPPISEESRRQEGGMEAQQGQSQPQPPLSEPQAPLPAHRRVQFQQAPQIIPPNPLQYSQLPPPSGAPAYPFSKNWHLAKIIFGCASLVTSVVVLGLGIYVSLISYAEWGSLLFGLTGTAAGMAILWQGAEFITLCASRDRRGMHPGGHVALHLLIWLMAAAAVICVSIIVAEAQDEYYYYYDSSYSYYELTQDQMNTLVAAEQALLAFTVVLMVIHFVLFVRACVETHQRNSMPRTIYVQVPVQMDGSYGTPFSYYGPPPPQGMQYPPPMQMIHAPQPQGMPYPPPMQMSKAPQPDTMTPQQALHQGYYAPTTPQNVHVPPQQSSLYGYYAPPATRSSVAAAPPRQSRRAPSPSVASSSEVGNQAEGPRPVPSPVSST